MPFVLETRDISLVRGGLPVLGGVEVEVGEWEIVGLVGASGAGKTAFVDCVSGLVEPDGGSVRIRGEDVTGLSAHRRVGLGMARTWQGLAADPSSTVMENVLTAQHQHTRYSPVGGILGGPASFLEEEELRENAEEILFFLGLLPVAGELVGELPTGMRRFCDLAMALATDPDLLVLDEPVLGMSRDEAGRLGEILRFLRDSLNLTTLFTDRSLELAGVCDFVYVLSAGTVLAKGKPGEILGRGAAGPGSGPAQQ